MLSKSLIELARAVGFSIDPTDLPDYTDRNGVPYAPPAPKEGLFRRDVLAAAMGLGVAAAGTHYYKEYWDRTQRFFTNFTEADPLANWRFWTDNARLDIEKHGSKMSGVPTGALIFGPDRELTHSRVAVEFELDEPAEFIVRGADPENCTILRVLRDTQPGQYSSLRVSVNRKRRGKSTHVDLPRAQSILMDRTFTERKVQKMIVEMSGPNVAARLARDADGPLQQLTQGVRLTAGLKKAVGWIDDSILLPAAPQVERALTSWTDTVYSSGHFGVWGRDRLTTSDRKSFRLFSLTLEG